MESQLDIAFVIDTTGSMGSCIEQVKQNVKKIVSDISTLVSCNNIRCSVIGYKDHCDPEVVKVHCEFTSNMNTVQSAVNQLYPSGGGDFPEAVTDGLFHVPRLDWRPNAVKTVVLIGDAPPHGCGASGDSYPDGCPCKEEWTEQVQACREMGIVIHTVNCTAGTILAWDKIAKDTFGQCVMLKNVTGLASVITGVAQVDFDKFRFANQVNAKIKQFQQELSQLPDEARRIQYLAFKLQKETLKEVNVNLKVNVRKTRRSDIEQAIAIIAKQFANSQISQLFPEKSNAVTKTEGGLFSSIMDDSGNKLIVPLQSVEVSVDVKRGCARVEISQTYCNDTKDAIECTYQFPVDDLAAVCGFIAEIDGKKIIAKCMEKQKAQEKYDDSIASGHGAFLLEQKRSDVFTMSVGNLLSKQKVTIRIQYVTPVEQNEAGEFRFVLSTTVAPKYTPPSSLQSQNENEDPMLVSKVPYKLAVNMDIEMTSSITDITSPTHDITVNTNKNKATVALKEAELNSDFVILFRQKEDQPFQFYLENQPSSNSNSSQDKALLISLKPSFIKERSNLNRDVILVLDCSASMIGSQFAEAQKAAEYFVEMMSERDGVRYNIVCFGSKTSAAFGTCRGTSSKNDTAAKEFIFNLQSNLGGTQLLKALDKVSEVASGAKNADVILISDGQLADDQRISKAVLEKSQQGFRFFTIGVGLSINYSVIRGLARIGQGAAEFRISGETESIADKIDRHLSRIFDSATSVSCDWGALTEVFPCRRPPIIKNTRLNFYALLGSSVDINKPIQVKISAMEFNYEMTFDLKELTASVSGLRSVIPIQNLADSNLVHLLAGRELIREYEESKLASRTCKIDSNRVISLATSLCLASSLTSFVAVDEREEAQPYVMKKKDVPVSAPAKETSSSSASVRHRYKATIASDAFMPSSISLAAPMERKEAAGCCGGGDGCTISSEPAAITRIQTRRNSFKVVMVGESGCGKSSIVTRFVSGSYTEGSSTIGAVFQVKSVMVGQKEIKLECWDTAGQERFRSLAPIYLRAADIAIIVFDLTSKESFNQAVKFWLVEVHAKCPANVMVILVGNKKDAKEPTAEEREEYQSVASKNGITFVECSAKTGEGIQQLFEDMAKQVSSY
eukprot:CAMPEP_0168546528 /NCGR_PEP_ID=MMETSP0413-20121227/3547_1 /TAXON_ID=136452 /ORGANISM="Filamoeba nolandi, Strain NC-AS-23-1" /LENGTH=1128 /DNA_ID=CAMNT_0008576713 /DNA_START=165 /DNA_END=3551 /DNA_ORIENTATION=+